jgi:hypothetical protein
MKKALRAVICDDDETRGREDWAERIVGTLSPHYDVDPKVLSTYELASTLQALEARSALARRPAVDEDNADDMAAVVDAADVLIVDYDLTPEPSRNAEGDGREQLIRSQLRSQTAESVAYLARCYSSCGAIMIVNQTYRQRTFDLTMTKFAESRAEVNVSQQDVASPELWIGEGDDFHPWSWPVLADGPSLLDRRVALVDLEAPVLESLGLLPLETSGLDIRQLDALGDAPLEATFRKVATSPELGLVGKDEAIDDEGLKRVAAAGVGRWLDSVVLLSQNVLVDAPHLIARFPTLLPGDPNDVASWNAVVQTHSEIAHNELLQSASIPACDWFHRPTWFWANLARNTAIEEVSKPWTTASYEWVFCEDISRFVSFDEAREVRTDLPGPYSRRFVANRPDVQYLPNPQMRIVR